MLQKLFNILIFFLFYMNDGIANSNLIPKEINQLIKKHGLQSRSLGLSILKKSESKQESLYQLNANRLFVPASLTKIATLSAIYHYMPSRFQFKTDLLTSAPIKNGNQLDGDLILKAGGDSSFISESLWNLVNRFTRTGITKIKGDLVIDNTIYKKSYFLPYTDRSYTAPVSAASFNWNSVAFWIKPAQSAALPAHIYVDPENQFIKVINKVKTVSKSKTRIFVKRIKYSSKGETFLLRGLISDKSQEVVKYSNIQSPSYWLGYNLKSFLKQRDIVVQGRIKTGSCVSCPVLASFKSYPLHFHAHNMMKYSNNFVTRMLTTHLPLQIGRRQGDLYEGTKMIRQYLNKVVGLKGYKFIEPSGLSRKNRFSANHFQQLLLDHFSKFYQNEIWASYPVAGGVGTLNKRLSRGTSYLNVRAKTGALFGVLGLSGYIDLPKNQKIIFTFLYNGSHQNIHSVKRFFDDLIFLLWNRYRV